MSRYFGEVPREFSRRLNWQLTPTWPRVEHTGTAADDQCSILIALQGVYLVGYYQHYGFVSTILHQSYIGENKNAKKKSSFSGL